MGSMKMLSVSASETVEYLREDGGLCELTLGASAREALLRD